MLERTSVIRLLSYQVSLSFIILVFALFRLKLGNVFIYSFCNVRVAGASTVFMVCYDIYIYLNMKTQ